MKVLRKSDRVKFKIKDIEVTIAPLSYRDRIELSTLTTHQSGEVKLNWVEQTTQLFKKCVKDITGLKDFQGNDYGLSFNEAGELDDDCVDELMACFEGVGQIAVIQASNSEISPITTNSGDTVEFTVLGK